MRSSHLCRTAMHESWVISMVFALMVMQWIVTLLISGQGLSHCMQLYISMMVLVQIIYDDIKCMRHLH